MPSHFIQANTNGRLHSADEPSLSPLDRSFLYGDAIYEVWRTYDGIVFTFDEHWRRLEASARSLHLTLPFDAATAFAEIKRTVAAFRERTGYRDDVYIRLQLSRGAGDIGLDPALADRATWVFLVQPLPAVSAEKLRRGVTVALARDIRRNHPQTLNPLWKTGNYLNNLLALREARARGAEEVLLLNLAGELTEAATMNVMFVRDGAVLTPPLSAGMLAGITRQFFLTEVAPSAGITVREVPLRPEDLASMQEAFFVSTTKDITPIAAIDAQPFATGESTLTWSLKKQFREAARAHSAAHPRRAV